jgi:5'-nucleotidase
LSYSLEGKLVIGITSRALFDLDEADAVFRTSGLTAYREYQRKHETELLSPGTAFPMVRALLAINSRASKRLVEVIVISRNDADSGLRVFNSAKAHQIDITRGAFTDGRDPWKYLAPLNCNLFLSAEPDDVDKALGMGCPAALILPPPESVEHDVEEVRIAFDGDAVLFDDESERVFQEHGLKAFEEREEHLANVPMNPGPFEPFLRALHEIQAHFDEEHSPIRTAIVTARAAPAHLRVINTLRAWNVRVDESFFLGGLEKGNVLAALRPHIYFDDQRRHLDKARARTASAHVPVQWGRGSRRTSRSDI